MKKRTRKLNLAKTTIRELDAEHLHRAAGGRPKWGGYTKINGCSLAGGCK